MKTPTRSQPKLIDQITIGIKNASQIMIIYRNMIDEEPQFALCRLLLDLMHWSELTGEDIMDDMQGALLELRTGRLK
jgi:hypothetical protein